MQLKHIINKPQRAQSYAEFL